MRKPTAHQLKYNYESEPHNNTRLNLTNMISTACPFYYGEERYMHSGDNRKKKFNPIIDMLSEKLLNS